MIVNLIESRCLPLKESSLSLCIVRLLLFTSVETHKNSVREGLRAIPTVTSKAESAQILTQGCKQISHISQSAILGGPEKGSDICPEVKSVCIAM